MIMDPLGECAKTSDDNGKAHVTIPIDAVAVSMKRISMAVHESSATPIVTKLFRDGVKKSFIFRRLPDGVKADESDARSLLNNLNEKYCTSPVAQIIQTLENHDDFGGE